MYCNLQLIMLKKGLFIKVLFLIIYETRLINLPEIGIKKWKLN